MQLGDCPRQPLVAPNSCRSMSVGTEEGKSIVQIVTRKLMWRRTGEGLEATYHGCRRGRISSGLAQHRSRGLRVPRSAVCSNDRVTEGRHIWRRADRDQAGRRLEVRVQIRTSLTLLTSTGTMQRAVQERAAICARSGTVGGSRSENIVDPVKFTAGGRTILELRA